MRTSPGLALLKLETAHDAMQLPLKVLDPDEDNVGALLNDALKLVSSSDYSLLKVAEEDQLYRPTSPSSRGASATCARARNVCTMSFGVGSA
jgi:hypothetical protein